jgi:hypothetical protein
MKLNGGQMVARILRQESTYAEAWIYAGARNLAVHSPHSCAIFVPPGASASFRSISGQDGSRRPHKMPFGPPVGKFFPLRRKLPVRSARHAAPHQTMRNGPFLAGHPAPACGRYSPIC